MIKSSPQPDRPPPPAHTDAAVVSLRDLRAVCTTCSLRELCMPFGLTVQDLSQIDTLVSSRKRLRKGEVLYQAGDRFDALYAVWRGSFKNEVLAEDGRQQVTGYHMVGDVVGLDGIATERHTSRATALEDSDVCVLRFEHLEMLAQRVPALHHNLQRFLSREIARDHAVMLLLGSMRAEERVAAFLLDLAERCRRRGYSSTQFALRMRREEIGSYLGLKLETVSRLLSRLQQEGVIRIQGRDVTLLDTTALRQLCSSRE